MNYEQFERLAKEYYNKGGDSFFECWDRGTFSGYVNMHGEMTKQKALKLFHENFMEEEEERKTIEYFSSYEAQKLMDDDIDPYPIDNEVNPYPFTSCTGGDYSPSSPWDAPGMSVHDFI